MPDKVMSFSDHLQELRARLGYSLLALVVCSAIAYTLRELLFAWLARPLIRAWQDAGLGAPKLHFANPIEPFFTYIKVALLGGLFLAIPFIFYQLWRFVAPGLKTSEKKFVIPFSFFSTVCFVGGACFGYFIVFPHGFRFLLGFAQSDLGALQKILGDSMTLGVAQNLQLQPTLMMGEYFALVWRLLVAFGVVFELPLLITFLAMANLVTHRTLWRWNPYFVILAFVISALLTPPDVITQLLMAAPLIALYNLSILLAWFFSRGKD